jgi:hypothetical protein
MDVAGNGSKWHVMDVDKHLLSTFFGEELELAERALVTRVVCAPRRRWLLATALVRSSLVFCSPQQF